MATSLLTIPGFPTYRITPTGNVYSCKHRKFLKWLISNKGYPRVCLYKEGKAEYKLVHRLVAITYIPNPLNLPYVLHNDDDRSHPYRDNLHWGTALDNIKECISRNRYTALRGSDNGQAVKLRVIHPKGHTIVYNSIREASSSLNIHYSSITYSLCRNEGVYKGYKFIREYV